MIPDQSRGDDGGGAEAGEAEQRGTGRGVGWLAALRRAQAKQAKELGAIDGEIAEIERLRREIERRQRRELGEMDEKAERERARYERGIEPWHDGGYASAAAIGEILTALRGHGLIATE